MLIGQYSSKLTEGSRVAVPKKIRDELGAEMIIAKWYEGSLILVSQKKWHDLVVRLTGSETLITSPVRDIDRFIYGSAYEVILDGQGRFVIPEILINYAGLTTDIEFIGLGDRIEIWSSQKWSELEMVAEAKAAEAIENISRIKFKK